MKNKDISMNKAKLMEYKNSVKEAKKLADVIYGDDIKQAKKNKLFLYSIPTTMALTTASIAGIAHFDPSLIVTVGATATFGGTIISVMCVRKQIKEENKNIKSLKEKYDECVTECSLEQPSGEYLESVKDENVQKDNEFSNVIVKKR